MSKEQHWKKAQKELKKPNMYFAVNKLGEKEEHFIDVEISVIELIAEK